MTKSPGSFVKLSNTALVYEHTLQRFCVKLILEPFTFTQEQVVNIESTIMKRFVVALSFGNDQISRFKCLTGFAADMGKPGAADFASISDYCGQFDSKHLKKYMLSYLDIITTVSSIMLVRAGTQEALDKKKEMLEYIREQDLWLYHKLRYSILGRAANLPGRGGRKMFVAAYKVCQKFYGFN